VLLTLLLTWMVVYPVVLVIVGSVRGAEGWTGEYVAAFLREPREWAALWASLWISLASVLLAGLIGVPLGFVFERLGFPGRRLLGGLVALPAVLPPLVGVIAFLFLYGESGFVARAIMRLLGLQQSPWRLQGAGAILLVHAYSMYVYFYLFTRVGLARMDASMIEAAHSLGCGTWATLRRVTLPLLRPQLAAAALLTFMTALGSFSAPYIFGGGFRVMTTQIVASKLNGDMPMAIVETTALAALALIGLLLLRGRAEARSVVAVGKGTPPAARALSQPLARWGATVVGWAFAVALLLPHVTLVVVSLVPIGTWTTQLVPPEYTLGNYAALATEPERLRPLMNSLWMAALATGAAIGIALWAGRLVVQRRAALRGVIETLLSVPWAVPGTRCSLPGCCAGCSWERWSFSRWRTWYATSRSPRGRCWPGSASSIPRSMRRPLRSGPAGGAPCGR
jgi:iron(III) transport system permease protein